MRNNVVATVLKTNNKFFITDFNSPEDFLDWFEENKNSIKNLAVTLPRVFYNVQEVEMYKDAVRGAVGLPQKQMWADEELLKLYLRIQGLDADNAVSCELFFNNPSSAELAEVMK